MITPQDREIDERLTNLSQSYRFLLDLTPTNVSEARTTFLASATQAPSFEYRPLRDRPDRIRAAAKEIDVSAASDPTLKHLFAAKRSELELQAEMLAARDTEDFLSLSIELFGAVTPRLVATAERILDSVRPSRALTGACLDAEAVADRMTGALESYWKAFAPLSTRVEIRDDTAGVMVSNGDVLIAESVTVSSSRIEGLLAHEVDTHVLTYLNGARQPLKLLAAGLAGYEETQEGLALIAEVLVEGLTSARLRQIAARVVAVDRLIQGVGFPDLHRELVEIGFSPGGAFGIAMRVFRSGGLTKDAGYLRALQAIAEHLAHDGELDSLWMGKMALVDLPLLQELQARDVLTAPAVLPSFLTMGVARRRIAEFAHDTGIHQLIGAES